MGKAVQHMVVTGATLYVGRAAGSVMVVIDDPRPPHIEPMRFIREPPPVMDFEPVAPVRGFRRFDLQQDRSHPSNPRKRK